ncbi:MAG: MBL fold metallo-hydrolase [Saccharofermentans sp.]|nr:MBL fold metallo-hydrolase [Saccharofermentans sp.]
MSATTIAKLKYGNTNTFLIRGGEGSVLVDTDYVGTMPMFYKAIKAQEITVKDINYVLATHYHPDHIGLVSELMEQGVKLLLMESQSGSVHFADGIFAREPRLGYKPIDERCATVLTFENSRRFLAELGIDGEIISTPGHSPDSVSVVLDNGVCLVGDMEPYEHLSAYESWTDEYLVLKKDWKRILGFSPRTVFYSHANERVF